MRVDDLPAPVADWTPHPGGTDVARRLLVALERLPQAAYVWDDADDDAVVWDAPDDAYVWDAPFIDQGFTDAVCDFQSVVIEAGAPDDLGIFQSAHALIALANPTGEYSEYTADGRLVYWSPGRRVQILGAVDGELWWLFAGRVTRWDLQANGDVVVEAFDGFSLLNQEVGGEWIPGVAGESPAQRITRIAAARGYPDRLRLDAGDVTLAAPPTTRTPLVEIETVALSDGGAVVVDADGTLLYRDRTWPRGRPDQVTVRVFSDNVCAAPVIVWDLVLTANDDALATVVRLVNTAGDVAESRLPGGLFGLDYVLAHPDPDLWQSATDGRQLAGVLLAQRSTPSVGVESFTLHLGDPQQDLWRPGIDLRLGDRIRFVHEFPAAGGGTATLDVYLVVTTITHEINPDEWVMTVGTTRTVDHTPVEQWDRTRYVWDDPDPGAVWRY